MKSRPSVSDIPIAVRELYDALPTPVHFFRDDNSNIWVNQAMDEFLGYEPGEISRLGTTDLYFEYGKENHEKLVQEFLDLGHARGRIMVARKDGRLHEIDFQSTANVLPGIHLTTWEAPLTAVLVHDHFIWPSAPVGPDFHLTRREFQVFELVADGAGNAQIAGALGIAEATAQQHVDAARVKIGASNRAEMVARGIGAGLLKPKRPGELFLLLAETPEVDSGRRARISYISPAAIIWRPALGKMLGATVSICQEGEAAIPSNGDQQDGIASTLFLDGQDVHFHGSISSALGPESVGTVRRFDEDVVSVVVSPTTGSRPVRIGAV